MTTLPIKWPGMPASWGKPDPSLEDTVNGILKFMYRKGIISVAAREVRAVSPIRERDAEHQDPSERYRLRYGLPPMPGRCGRARVRRGDSEGRSLGAAVRSPGQRAKCACLQQPPPLESVSESFWQGTVNRCARTR